MQLGRVPTYRQPNLNTAAVSKRCCSAYHEAYKSFTGYRGLPAVTLDTASQSNVAQGGTLTWQQASNTNG